jgi:predicted site-specific integrase-resolvase
MSEKLLTPEQAATLLHLKPKTLARWRWAGCGPRFIKIGGRVRYAESDLQAFIQAGVRTSTSDTGSVGKSAW